MTDESILKDIRIIDFTWVLAGPYGTRLLADYGAEVIKVLPLLPAEDDTPFARSYYNYWNRNKLGVGLNLNSPEGIKLAKKLVAVSDAVIENFTPRVMANWGLSYENLKKIKQDIIMLSMSVMGQTGPWRDYTGYGPTVQAFSGMTALTSFGKKAPLGPGFSYADHVAGLYASMALLGALEHRRQTGEGQFIDISQVEATASLLGGAIMETSSGEEVGPRGNYSSKAAPHNVYKCRDDSWIAVSVYSDDEWDRLKSVMGNPLWADDEKYTGLSGRLDNRKELDDILEKWTRRYSGKELMTLLQINGIAAGVVQDASDLMNDPRLVTRDFFIKDKEAKEIVDASPIKFSRTPAIYRGDAPATGRDNDYVYRRLLGLSVDEITRLEEQGII
ncbi:MAG: CoA transferase [Dehalococcoidia bacterium]|jgi:crotonobetainyl-CoA:carnitine CoA-transferase CaiB-like acyl-CoA transferase